MNRLLNAGFSRLVKNRYFWIFIVFMAGFGAAGVTSEHASAVKYNYTAYIDGSLFALSLFLGIVIAAFVSLFLGAEYSDGTVRNKIAVGHRRGEIYGTNLVICAVVSFAAVAAYMVFCAAFGIAFGMEFAMGFREIAAMVLVCMMMSAAFTALAVTAAMLCQNKASTAVITILGVIALLIAASYVEGRLAQPEMVSNYYYDAETEMWLETEEFPNPAYVRGIERRILTEIDNFLPTGQASQLSTGEISEPWKLMAYSSVIIVLSTAAGAAFFKKKDLK